MSVSLHDVHQALTELGRLRFGTMSVEDAMREIVQTTHTVFSVDGAGLMLTDTEQRLRGVAASDQRFAHLEDLQIEHGQGPCIEAFDTKQLVGTQDLEAEQRWPGFSAAAWPATCAPCWPARCPTTRMPWAWSRCCPSSGGPGRPRVSWPCWPSPTWPRCSSPA